MNIEFISIDNFYADPNQIRNLAINCEYLKPGFSNLFKFGNSPFPGIMSVDNYSQSDVDLKVSKILNKNLRQPRNKDSGKFRISKSTDRSKNIVHVDSTSSDVYAGVLYLCDENVDGTILYKHKQKKITQINDKNILQEIILDKDLENINAWEPTLISKIVYNRLIIYPANYFHGIGPLFGTTNSDSRVVQLFSWINIK